MASSPRAPLRTYGGRTAEERRSHRRSQLLQAGTELLGTGGSQATTVTAVCERARLTPRYFYESFTDRDELLVAIFDDAIATVTSEVLAATPSNTEEFLRATARAFVKLATHDPQLGRATFVEALGSEALMQRRVERMHWFAQQLVEVARAGRRLRKEETRRLQTAALVATGGLIEMMIAWLEGELGSTPEQLIDDYTHSSTAVLTAAVAAY